jgi:hypothetical protein
MTIIIPLKKKILSKCNQHNKKNQTTTRRATRRVDQKFKKPSNTTIKPTSK